VVFQFGFVAAIRDGVEIEVKDFGFGKQELGELADPTLEELFLMVALRAIGVIGRERFLGQDIEAGEEAERVVEIEVIDMAASFFVEEFENEQTEHGIRTWNHVGAGIVGIAHEAIEAELCEQGQKQKESGESRTDGRMLVQGEQSAIGDGGPIRLGLGMTGDGSPARSIGEKGGIRSWRMQARN
jgi:hypothetical protein